MYKKLFISLILFGLCNMQAADQSKKRKLPDLPDFSSFLSHEELEYLKLFDQTIDQTKKLSPYQLKVERKKADPLNYKCFLDQRNKSGREYRSRLRDLAQKSYTTIKKVKEYIKKARNLGIKDSIQSDKILEFVRFQKSQDLKAQDPKKTSFEIRRDRMRQIADSKFKKNSF